MNDRNADDLLRALAFVRDAGSILEPTWDPAERGGVVYRGSGSPLQDEELQAQLRSLAAEDYLEGVFIERISLCPNCGSHAVNIHEACLTCGSSNLEQFKALFHFRCGFVGPISAFGQEPQGLRCPKCRKLLVDVGTDHDSPGDYFRCRACTSMFQVPNVGARCVSCGVRYSGDGMQDMHHRDVFAYRLTAIGKAALREGRLIDDKESAQLADGMLERRHVIVADVEKERNRRRDARSKFGTIVIGLGAAATHSVVQTMAMTIRRRLTDSFKLGRLDSGHIVMLLPDASDSLIKAIRDQIVQVKAPDGSEPLTAEIAEISDGGSVADALDSIAQRTGTHA